MTDELTNKDAHAVTQKIREQYPDATYKIISTHEGITREEMEAILAEHVRELRAQGHELPLQEEEFSPEEHEFIMDVDPAGEYVLKYGQLTVGIHSEVFELYDVTDLEQVVEEIDTYMESILPRINIEDLSGWKLTIGIEYVRTESILVSKKMGRYPSHREYINLMSIPIPDDTQAPYGIPCSEDEPIEYREPKRKSDFHILDPEYDKYDNIDQYILASTIKAIEVVFTNGLSKGFTGFWKKIKFQDL